MIELKPCPFCGSNGELCNGVGEWWVLCLTCQASSAMESTEELAVERWNSRATFEKNSDGVK